MPEVRARRRNADRCSRRSPVRAGLPVGPFWTAPKIEALIAAHPEVGNRRRWLSVASWVVAKLGGDPVAELSLASRTGFLDVSRRAWWPRALDRVGLSADVMAPLIMAGVPVGRVTRVPELAGATLTVAGHDHPCASVGAGAAGLRDAFDSCGTAEAILRSLPVPVDPNVILDAASCGHTVVATSCRIARS
jgi:sugar (pentulose or hexulose) kinase